MTETPQPLSPAAFDRLIDIHGGDPTRWPAADRAAALALAAASPAAAARLEEARHLDRLLDRLPSADPSPALQARILADADRLLPPVDGRPSRRGVGLWRRLLDGIGPALWPGLPAWQPSAVLGLSLAAGLALGLTDPGLLGVGGDLPMGDVSTLMFAETVLEEGWP